MELLPTDQITFYLPGGYRYATTEEEFFHLNGRPIPNAIWTYPSFEDYGEVEGYVLAVPRDNK